MGALEVRCNEAVVFVGRGAVELDYRRSQMNAEIVDGPDVEERERRDAELLGRKFHVEEHLLQQRIFAGFRGLVHHHILAFT